MDRFPKAHRDRTDDAEPERVLTLPDEDDQALDWFVNLLIEANRAEDESEDRVAPADASTASASSAGRI